MSTERKEITVWFLTPDDSYLQQQLQDAHSIYPHITTRIMDPARFDLSVSSDGLDSIVYEGVKIPLPTAVVPRVASDYFTLAVVRQFESLGVHVFNSTAAIEIAMDRMYTHQIISAAGLPIPKSVLSRSPFELEYIEQHFGYPVVLKYIASSKDEQWYTFSSRAELESRMATLDINKPMIFQEYDAYQRQYDVRVMVIGNQAVAAIKKDGSPFSLTTHAGITSIATRTVSLCHLSFATIDILVDGTDPSTETFRVTCAHFDPDLSVFDAQGGNSKPLVIQMLDVIQHDVATPINSSTSHTAYTKLTKRVIPIPIQDDHK